MKENKIAEENRTLLNAISISEAARLHDEFGFCFECNDGEVKYSYIENAA